jgi:hypothetical protein
VAFVPIITANPIQAVHFPFINADDFLSDFFVSDFQRVVVEETAGFIASDARDKLLTYSRRDFLTAILFHFKDNAIKTLLLI